MNTTLVSERSLDRREQHESADLRSPRLSVLDRLALRLGLWLLLRSTRRLHTVRDHRGHEAARAAQRARYARDAVSLDHLRAHRA